MGFGRDSHVSYFFLVKLLRGVISEFVHRGGCFCFFLFLFFFKCVSHKQDLEKARAPAKEQPSPTPTAGRWSRLEVRVRGVSGAVRLDGDEGVVGRAVPPATRRQRDDSPAMLKETRVHTFRGPPSWEFGTHQDGRATQEPRSAAVWSGAGNVFRCEAKSSIYQPELPYVIGVYIVVCHPDFYHQNVTIWMGPDALRGPLNIQLCVMTDHPVGVRSMLACWCHTLAWASGGSCSSFQTVLPNLEQNRKKRGSMKRFTCQVCK